MHISIYAYDLYIFYNMQYACMCVCTYTHIYKYTYIYKYTHGYYIYTPVYM